jgi:hypothetical protein
MNWWDASTHKRATTYKYRPEPWKTSASPSPPPTTFTTCTFIPSYSTSVFLFLGYTYQGISFFLSSTFFFLFCLPESWKTSASPSPPPTPLQHVPLYFPVQHQSFYFWNIFIKVFLSFFNFFFFFPGFVCLSHGKPVRALHRLKRPL